MITIVIQLVMGEIKSFDLNPGDSMSGLLGMARCLKSQGELFIPLPDKSLVGVYVYYNWREKTGGFRFLGVPRGVEVDGNLHLRYFNDTWASVVADRKDGKCRYSDEIYYLVVHVVGGHDCVIPLELGDFLREVFANI